MTALPLPQRGPAAYMDHEPYVQAMPMGGKPPLAGKQPASFAAWRQKTLPKELCPG
jgi:hypothetical protein